WHLDRSQRRFPRGPVASPLGCPLSHNTKKETERIAPFMSHTRVEFVNLPAPVIALIPSTGPVPLVITSAAGSGSSTVTLAPFGPYFFLPVGKHAARIL